MTINRVILSWPTLLSVANGGTTHRSWIQIARTGSFTSSKYGEFTISREDLAQMLSNFRSVTPQPPTELPIDFDHLSMAPKRPGDGIAAGWIKQLELRADGDELWAEVEWTSDGAKRIANNEYRFVSPSFVKDHTHKDGRKIGTTLLAAAITNHPFLEGMQALTLYNFNAMGDLALMAQLRPAPAPENMKEPVMSDAIINSATRFAGIVQRHLDLGVLARDAFVLAQAEDGEGAEAYRLAGIGARAAAPGAVVSLSGFSSTAPGETFEEAVARRRTQKGLAWREAILEVARERPDLVEGR